MAKEGKYRISLERELYEKLEKALRDDHFDLWLEIQRRTKEPGATVRHHVALVKLAEKKKRKTEEKIENAVRLLLLEEKEPTIYRVAKTAGISYATAKRYAKEIDYYAQTISLYSSN